MTVLEIELRNAGWPRGIDAFRVRVRAEYDGFMGSRARGMKPEDFLLRPALAMDFADRVRTRLRSHSLQDHTILAVLVGRSGAA